jgi:hypothetical protein
VSNLFLSQHAAYYSQQVHDEVRNKAFADVAAVLKGEEPSYPGNRVQQGVMP